MKYTSDRYTTIFQALDFDNYPPSVANLPDAMTINGRTVYPTFRYNGKDASAAGWPAWGYGGTLSKTGTTQPTYDQGSPLLGILDSSIKMNGTGAGADNVANFQGTNTFGNVGLNDIVVEIVANSLACNAYGLIICCKDSAGTGWDIRTTPTTWVTYINATAVPSAAGTGTPPTGWDHIIMFCDRSGSGQPYINGVSTGGANISASVASNLNGLSNTPHRLGAYLSNTYGFSGNVAYAAMWQGLNWLDTHLQATVAQTRFAQLTGVYPQKASGVYLPTYTTRASSAYLDKVESNGSRKLYLVGSNWPRSCSRKDLSSSKITKGFLSEQTLSNYCVQSEALNTTWTPYAATINANVATETAPNGVLAIVDAIRETAITDIHVVYNGLASMTTGTIYCFSCFLKKPVGGRRWAFLRLDALTLKYVWFDLENGVTGGTSGSPQYYGIENWGNGWYRCWIAHTCTGDGTGYWYIATASADSTAIFLGVAGQDQLLAWGAQVETGNAVPSSYIPTTTAAVVRSMDLLAYNAAGNINTSAGTIMATAVRESGSRGGEYLMRIENAGGTGAHMLGGFSSGGSQGKKFIYWIQDTSYNVQSYSSSDFIDGNTHTVKCCYQTNLANSYLDDVILNGVPDTSCSTPTSLTKLIIGNNAVVTGPYYPWNGLICNVKLLSGPTKKG